MSRRATEWLLTAGVIGPFLFVLAFTVIGAVRSDYNPVRMFVSWLSLEEGAWAEIANLIVFGVLTVGGALGLRRAMRVGRGARLGPILIGLAGVALVVTGAFVPDPSNLYPPDGPGKPKFASISALLHDGAAGVVFFSLALAMLVVARRLPQSGAGGRSIPGCRRRGRSGSWSLR